MRPAVFLDRDDTLIDCRGVVPDGDLGDPALVRPLPGVLEGCRTLADSGFTLVVVSNQGGVARGKYTESAVHAVNEEINRQLGGLIERFYFCPFHPEGTVPEYAREHPWRKPAPGMLLQAAADLGIDLSTSWMVGDSWRDVEAGRAAGCRTVYIGQEEPDLERIGNTLPAGSLAMAANLIAVVALMKASEPLYAPPPPVTIPPRPSVHRARIADLTGRSGGVERG